MVDTRGERRVIGGKASEMEGVAWIRGFKEGETQLRILEPADKWWKFPEHYKSGLGFFACNSPTKDPDPSECIGCADPSERVQNRGYKYAFNAIDKDGRVRVFKLGGKLRKTLRQREQTLGKDVLQRRDIVIIRTGTGFGDTEYAYEWAEEYEVDGGLQTFIDQSNDLGETVTESYWEAVRKLEEEADEGAEPEAADDVIDESAEAEPEPAKTTAAKKAAPAKKTAAAKKTTAGRGRLGTKPAEEPEVTDVTPETPGPDGETGEVLSVNEDDIAAMVDKLRGWDSDDIRDHLEKFEVEFPARCPKPRLLAIAEQALMDGKLPPF